MIDGDLTERDKEVAAIAFDHGVVKSAELAEKVAAVLRAGNDVRAAVTLELFAKTLRNMAKKMTAEKQHEAHQ